MSTTIYDDGGKAVRGFDRASSTYLYLQYVVDDPTLVSFMVQEKQGGRKYWWISILSFAFCLCCTCRSCSRWRRRSSWMRPTTAAWSRWNSSAKTRMVAVCAWFWCRLCFEHLMMYRLSHSDVWRKCAKGRAARQSNHSMAFRHEGTFLFNNLSTQQRTRNVLKLDSITIIAVGEYGAAVGLADRSRCDAVACMCNLQYATLLDIRQRSVIDRSLQRIFVSPEPVSESDSWHAFVTSKDWCERRCRLYV